MFSETLSYWQKRKKRFGDKCVGNVGENHTAQGQRIIAELTRVLGERFVEHGLDYGCGYGRITPWLVPRCGHVWAVDLFSDWTGRAASVAKTVTPVVLAGGYQLPFEDGAFDLVLDIMTLQSINERDWKDCAGELARVTAVGGTIVSLMKPDMVKAGDHEIVDLLEVEASVVELDTVDKSRDPYCLIVGTKL